MVTVPTLPGLYYQQVPSRAEPSPLRSDVAGLVGRTRRGPAGRAVRVEGYREFQYWFGGLDVETDFSYAVKGYFDNGGQVAHIVRVIGPQDRTAVESWQIDFKDKDDNPLRRAYRIAASSPGSWANRLRINITLFRPASDKDPILEFRIASADGEREQFQIVLGEPDPSADEPPSLQQQVAQQSQLIRLSPLPSGAIPQQPIHVVVSEAVNLPREYHWPEIELHDTVVASNNSLMQNFRQALKRIADQPEVAIAAMPGAERHLSSEQLQQLQSEAAQDAASLQDRIFLADLPHDVASGNGNDTTLDSVTRFTARLREQIPSSITRRAVACYFPMLRVPDPLGGSLSPLRAIAPSGHIAGVISRIDRDRGAQHTPANVQVNEAVDIETVLDRANSGQLSEDGVNLIRCVPGRGLLVWGGRTLDRSREGRFLAHRRFMHRLVRAIRRVAEPLVFDTSGPELWFALVRTVTTVLTEAFRSGALQGERPEEAFRIVCDENTNPLTDREHGRVLCEIGVALAAPMEFITIRVAISQTGQLEVFDQ